jgi:hypothetical protein
VTKVVSQRNVRLSEALRRAAPLEGANRFLDEALRTGAVALPSGGRLLGDPAREREFLVFLRTVTPWLPTSPASGPGSVGEVLLRSGTNETWLVAFHYGPRPSVRVRRLAWVDVPLGKSRALKVARGGPPGVLYSDGRRSVRLRLARTVLTIERHEGARRRTTTRGYAHQWQAEAALEREAAAARRLGLRRSRG